MDCDLDILLLHFELCTLTCLNTKVFSLFLIMTCTLRNYTVCSLSLHFEAFSYYPSVNYTVYYSKPIYLQLGSWNFERMFTSLHVSHTHIVYYMSHATCQVSHVMCHMSHICFFSFVSFFFLAIHILMCSTVDMGRCNQGVHLEK